MSRICTMCNNHPVRPALFRSAISQLAVTIVREKNSLAPVCLIPKFDVIHTVFLNARPLSPRLTKT